MLSVQGITRPGITPADLHLGKGERIALTGPSGAGKSLLLRAIADLDPNEGRVTLNGEERATFTAPDWRRRVCYLAAESGWWEPTAGAHFPDPEALKPLLTRLGLGIETLRRPVGYLSTGEKQRLALIRLLVQSPPVMLLDEPTAALDDERKKVVEDILLERCEDGAALLIVTHDAEQASRLGAKRMVMENGLLGALSP